MKNASHVLFETTMHDDTDIRSARVMRSNGKIDTPCARCPKIPFRFCRARGSQEPLVYAVGEAPGSQEDIARIPFVGPAGKLLDAGLGLAGFTAWTDVRLFNVTACAPRDGVEGPIRTPTTEEALNCSAYVKADIMASQPKGLLLLGRVATQAFFGTVEKVKMMPVSVAMNLSEQKPWKWMGIPTVVVWHPSYLVRKGGENAAIYSGWVYSLKVFRQRLIMGKA